MIDWQARYERLATAVRAYERTLRAYGLVGDTWVDSSDKLDQLWSRVIEALDPNPGPDTRAGRHGP